MPPLIRKRLTCFYCSSRSAQPYHAGLRSWNCERCDATNHLDEKGSFTEPPPPPTPKPFTSVRFGRPASPPRIGNSVPSPPRYQMVFCNTCLHNQHIVRQLLADYLPVETHPRYREYVANYSKYQRELEDRYPQCCPLCAVKAREMIQQTQKLAQSDHLGRLMDRTRAMGFQTGGLVWKDLGLEAGRLAWWVSLLFAMVWHILAAGVSVDRDEYAMDYQRLPHSLPERARACAGFVYEEKILLPGCIPDLTPLILWSLALGLVSIWWHPHLWMLFHRQNRPGFLGLPTYYFLQLVSLVIRIFASKLPVPYTATPSLAKQETLKGLHALVCMSLLMLTWAARKSIQFERKPAVLFHLDADEILPDIPLPDPNAQPATDWRPSFLSTQPAPEFDINWLNPPTPQPPQPPQHPQHPQHPLTPPPEENYHDPDAMDWSPSGRTTHTALYPQRRAAPPPPQQQGPSPFHGTLPPAPLPPAHRLLNPNAYNPSIFRKATELSKQNFFGGVLGSAGNAASRRKPYENDSEATTAATAEASSAPTPGYANGRAARGSAGRRHEIDIPHQRFWPAADSATTGLEDMFGGRNFGLQDSPLMERDGGQTEKSGWSWGW